MLNQGLGPYSEQVQNAKCVEVAPTIQRALEEQQKILSSLHETITMLESKTVSIRRSQPEKCEKSPQPTGNLIRELVNTHSEVIHNARSRIESILTSLELS